MGRREARAGEEAGLEEEGHVPERHGAGERARLQGLEVCPVVRLDVGEDQEGEGGAVLLRLEELAQHRVRLPAEQRAAGVARRAVLEALAVGGLGVGAVVGLQLVLGDDELAHVAVSLLCDDQLLGCHEKGRVLGAHAEVAYVPIERKGVGVALLVERYWVRRLPISRSILFPRLLAVVVRSIRLRSGSQ
jgi:hypothetical protein